MVNWRLKYFGVDLAGAKPPSLEEHAREPNGASRLRIGSCPRAGAGRARQHAALRPSARLCPGAAAAPRPYPPTTTGSQRDIEPASELLEDDDEQALPESEQDIDLAAAGPLAVGRAVIANHAKLAPSSPGVYRMIDAKGDVLYVGKAKNIRKRIIAYGRPTG